MRQGPACLVFAVLLAACSSPSSESSGSPGTGSGGSAGGSSPGSSGGGGGGLRNDVDGGSGAVFVEAGGSCPVSGRCLVTLASGQCRTNALAVNASDVYWTTQCTTSGNTIDLSHGALMKLPLSGGQPMMIAPNVGSFAVDSTGVYWASGGTVTKMPAAGGTPTTIASGLPGNALVRVVDAANLYLTNAEEQVTDAGDRFVQWSVTRLPLAGSTPNTLVSGQGNTAPPPPLIAVNATDVLLINTSPETPGGSWSGPWVMSLLKVPLGGGMPTTLVSRPNARAAAIAADGANVYWAELSNKDGGAIMSVPLGGGNPFSLASDPRAPVGLVVDDTNVYWAWTDVMTTPINFQLEGTVMSVPRGGGASTLLVRGQVPPLSFAVDATSLYWFNSAPLNNVVKLIPK